MGSLLLPHIDSLFASCFLLHHHPSLCLLDELQLRGLYLECFEDWWCDQALTVGICSCAYCLRFFCLDWNLNIVVTLIEGCFEKTSFAILNLWHFVVRFVNFAWNSSVNSFACSQWVLQSKEFFFSWSDLICPYLMKFCQFSLLWVEIILKFSSLMTFVCVETIVV